MSERPESTIPLVQRLCRRCESAEPFDGPLITVPELRRLLNVAYAAERVVRLLEENPDAPEERCAEVGNALTVAIRALRAVKP